MLRQTIILPFCILLCLGFSSCRDNSDVVTDTYQKPDTVFVEVQPERTIREWYIDTLRAYLGAREVNASNSGPLIDNFFEGCGVPKGNPYCGCFLNYGLLAIGGMGPSCPAWTPCWFTKNVVWKRDVDPESVTFQEGWTIGLYFHRLGRIAHVGSVVEDFGDGYIKTIEGNTNSAGSREGHGVFMRIRKKSDIFECSDWLPE